MLSLPTTGTYVLTSSLLFTVVLSQNQGFMSWLSPSVQEEAIHRKKELVDQQPREEMIAPKPEKLPDRVRPKPAPAEKYKSAPDVSRSEKKAAPTPPKSKNKTEFVDKAQVRLKDKLSEKAEADFIKKVARGEKLKNDGIDAPAYTAEMDPWMIDHLQDNGRIKLFVSCRRTNKTSSFVFPGGLSRPGKARSIINTEEIFDGFSCRGVPLSSSVAINLLDSISAQFSIPAEKCSVGAVFRSDIDAMVLAAQENAAKKMNLELKEVESTRGKFEQEGGLPFNYKVSAIKPYEGEWLRLEEDS